MEVQSATNGLESGKADVVELRVVANLETTTNKREERKADVADLLTVLEGKGALSGLANGSQVRSREALERVTIETEGPVDRDKLGKGDSGDVAEGHVVSPGQVGEGCSKSSLVGLDDQAVANHAKRQVQGVDITVVGQVESVNGVKGDTIKRLQASVLNVDGVGSLDGGGEGERLEVRQSVPDDGVNGRQLREVEGVQPRDLVQVQLAGDGLEAGATEADQLSHVVRNQVALDLLDAIQSDAVGRARRDGDATSEGLARSQASGITGVLDGGSGRHAAGSGYRDRLLALFGRAATAVYIDPENVKSSYSHRNDLERSSTRRESLTRSNAGSREDGDGVSQERHRDGCERMGSLTAGEVDVSR